MPNPPTQPRTTDLARHHRFHSDLQPGNLLGDPATGDLWIIDFSQVGELTADQLAVSASFELYSSVGLNDSPPLFSRESVKMPQIFPDRNSQIVDKNIRDLSLVHHLMKSLPGNTQNFSRLGNVDQVSSHCSERIGFGLVCPDQTVDPAAFRNR